MTERYTFRVADFPFSLWVSMGLPSIERLLPSFVPFRTEDVAEDEPLLFCFTVRHSLPDVGEKRLIEVTENDIGLLRLYAIPDGYWVEITYDSGICRHFMRATADFSSVEAQIDWTDFHAPYALTSMLRIAFAQAVLLHDAISLHASMVGCEGNAYLFMGKSGTGKSTHAQLWLQNIVGSELVNDDNPAVRIIDGVAYAYGTPWSGKTPCYRNLRLPIGGLVRLQQAPHNRFTRQEGVEAFVAVYPGCSVISQDTTLRLRLYDTLTRLCELSPVGIMECLPDAAAAKVCWKGITN